MQMGFDQVEDCLEIGSYSLTTQEYPHRACHLDSQSFGLLQSRRTYRALYSVFSPLHYKKYQNACLIHPEGAVIRLVLESLVLRPVRSSTRVRRISTPSPRLYMKSFSLRIGALSLAHDRDPVPHSRILILRQPTRER